MSDQPVLQIVINSKDERIVSEIEQVLKPVGGERWKGARADPVTIIIIITATVKLATALVQLKQQLEKKSDAPKVEMQTRQGASLDLMQATKKQLEELVSGLS